VDAVHRETHKCSPNAARTRQPQGLAGYLDVANMFAELRHAGPGGAASRP